MNDKHRRDVLGWLSTAVELVEDAAYEIGTFGFLPLKETADKLAAGIADVERELREELGD
jgi:hypothetical protein